MITYFWPKEEVTREGRLGMLSKLCLSKITPWSIIVREKFIPWIISQAFAINSTIYLPFQLTPHSFALTSLQKPFLFFQAAYCPPRNLILLLPKVVSRINFLLESCRALRDLEVRLKNHPHPSRNDKDIDIRSSVKNLETPIPDRLLSSSLSSFYSHLKYFLGSTPFTKVVEHFQSFNFNSRTTLFGQILTELLPSEVGPRFEVSPPVGFSNQLNRPRLVSDQGRILHPHYS